MKNLLLVVVFGISFTCFSQQGDQWKLFPGTDTNKIATSNDTKIKSFDLDFNATPGESKVIKDQRITDLVTWMGTPQKSDPTVRIRGYRVQLVFDQDKDNVNSMRAQYQSQYNENPAYVDYLQPNFRLRVGNFRTRLQAEHWAHTISTSFPDAVIVEDWIELPELKKEEEKK
ncbi:MAG TPA: SPOR domain-containing protein [Flavobacteriales bacterium]|nr:SPOR domain-containing protein [Flavobacteriales bacterium]